MQIIADTLGDIGIGEPLVSGNLSMFPLFGGKKGELDYVTLDEALAQGTATVTEISEDGHVPELRLVNKGDLAVLLVDGEELIGAKQNRILNLTILAPAHRELKIPVSCVEQGRWSYRSAAFRAAPRTQFAAGRARKVAAVSTSLRERRRPASDQGAVWNDVAEMAAKMKVASPTAAMSDIFEDYSDGVDEFVGSLSPVEGQVGAAFAINGKVIGFDLFDRASTLAKVLPKLVSGYAIEALAQGGGGAAASPSKEAVEGLLKAVSVSNGRTFPATGEGEDVRIEERGLCAAALVARGRVIHLCGFRNENNF